MPTRPIYRHLANFSIPVKRRRLFAMIAGIATGLICSPPTISCAEDTLQLSAPLNAAPQTIAAPELRPAADAWTARPASNTPAMQPAATGPNAASVVPVLPSNAEQTAIAEQAAPVSKVPVNTAPVNKVPAISVSGPLDRFRAPLTQLPSMKPAAPAPAPPGEVILDSPASARPTDLPAAGLPATDRWLGRAAGHRVSESTAAQPTKIAETEPDDFRSQAVSGNWVARDAINRVAPLRDPAAELSATVESKPIERKVDEFASRAETTIVAPQANSKSATADVSKPAIAKSMSLGESKPVAVSPPTKAVVEGGLADMELAPPATDQPKPIAGLSTVDNAPDLPKRTPLANLVDADLSSSKKDSSAKQSTAPLAAEKRNSIDQPAIASASAGDLKPTANSADSSVALDYTGRPTAPLQLTRTVANLRPGIERSLSYFYQRPEEATGRSNWGMMHSMMVFGGDTQVAVGSEKFSAIAWIAGNNNCRGQRLLTHDASGIQAKSGVGLQGHQGQFLAILGMCSVPADYPLYAGQVKYDVAGLIESEKKACKNGEELTFTLIGLSHYLDTDSSWIASDGTRWDFERLIAEELSQPIVGAACGGTHRLMGYTHALRKRRAENKPITGHWKRAETFTEDFINYAYSLQNRDGSMSTNWFEGRADDGDVDRKIQTTGHIVEWLLTVTPDEQLQDRRLVAAVSFLLQSLGSDLNRDWSIGPKGHALRALAMYHQRVYRQGTPWIPTSIARASESANSRR